MPFSVQNFKEALIGGGSRSNLFQVALNFPAVVLAQPAGQVFTFMCKAASLPAQDVGVIEVPYFGRQIKVPGDRRFNEWTITVINDESFNLRMAFEEWSNAINGHVSNLRDPNAVPSGSTVDAGYETDATVTQYTRTGKPVAIYTMVGAWPSTLSPISLSWDQNQAIEEFEVTLQYQWWTSSMWTDGNTASF